VGTFSIWHWFVLLFWGPLFVVPAWRIASRAGFSGALSLLMLVPLVNIVLLWVFAFITWPSEKSGA